MEVIWEGYNKQGLYLVVRDCDGQQHTKWYGSKEQYEDELKAYERYAVVLREDERKLWYGKYPKTLNDK